MICPQDWKNYGQGRIHMRHWFITIPTVHQPSSQSFRCIVQDEIEEQEKTLRQFDICGTRRHEEFKCPYRIPVFAKFVAVFTNPLS